MYILYIYTHTITWIHISVCVSGCVCDTTHTSRFSVPSNAYPTAGSFRVTTILGDGVVVLRPVIRLDSPKRVTQKAARVFQVSTVIFGKLTKTRPVIQLYSRNLSITCSVQFQIFSCIFTLFYRFPACHNCFDSIRRLLHLLIKTWQRDISIYFLHFKKI